MYKEILKSSMKFIGIGTNTTVQNAGKDCPVVWEQFMKRIKEIDNLTGGMKSYGISMEANEKECSFRYIASGEVSEFENIPEGMEKVEIPETKYLAFTHKGSLEKLGETYGGIMEETKDMDIDRNFWIEVYDERYKGNTDESEFEIWIPLKNNN
jgi:AraC family transcriptional regulator